MTFGSLNYLKQPSLLGPIDPICWSFCFTFKVLEVEMGEEDLFFFFLNRHMEASRKYLLKQLARCVTNVL